MAFESIFKTARTTLCAVFCLAEVSLNASTLAIGDITIIGDEHLTLQCGVPMAMKCSSDAVSIKFKGLPSGIRYDTKTASLVGTPSRTFFDKKVQVTLIDASRAKAVLSFYVTTLALPNWAVGEYLGKFSQVSLEEDGESANFEVLIKIGKQGSLTANFKAVRSVLNGTHYSFKKQIKFKAKSYTGHTNAFFMDDKTSEAYFYDVASTMNGRAIKARLYVLPKQLSNTLTVGCIVVEPLENTFYCNDSDWEDNSFIVQSAWKQDALASVKNIKRVDKYDGHFWGFYRHGESASTGASGVAWTDGKDMTYTIGVNGKYSAKGTIFGMQKNTKVSYSLRLVATDISDEGIECRGFCVKGSEEHTVRLVVKDGTFTQTTSEGFTYFF